MTRRGVARALAALGAAAGALAAGTGCRDGADPGDRATITVTRLGVPERGAVLAYRGPPGRQAMLGAIRLDPADAGVVFPGTDSLRLDRTGRVIVSIDVVASGGTVRVTDTLQVGEPPEIVFDADTAGNRDIWAMRLDGSNRRRITTEASDDREPTAANGQVVFVSGRSGTIELWRAPLAGGAATRLTTTAEEEGAPAMSAAGDRLAWLTGPAPSLVRLGGGDATGGVRFAPAATTAPNNEEFSPAISRAGDRVAFTTIRSGRPQVFVGTVGGGSGSATLAVGDDSTFNSEPTFSPDGTRLVVTRTSLPPGMPDRNDLFVVTLSSGTRARLTTTGTATQPAWLPDGRVVFRQPTAQGPRLFWVDPARPERVVAIPSGGLAPRAVDGVR